MVGDYYVPHLVTADGRRVSMDDDVNSRACTRVGCSSLPREINFDKRANRLRKDP